MKKSTVDNKAQTQQPKRKKRYRKGSRRAANQSAWVLDLDRLTDQTLLQK